MSHFILTLFYFHSRHIRKIPNVSRMRAGRDQEILMEIYFLFRRIILLCFSVFLGLIRRYFPFPLQSFRLNFHLGIVGTDN